MSTDTGEYYRSLLIREGLLQDYRRTDNRPTISPQAQNPHKAGGTMNGRYTVRGVSTPPPEVAPDPAPRAVFNSNHHERYAMKAKPRVNVVHHPRVSTSDSWNTDMSNVGSGSVKRANIPAKARFQVTQHKALPDTTIRMEIVHESAHHPVHGAVSGRRTYVHEMEQGMDMSFSQRTSAAQAAGEEVGIPTKITHDESLGGDGGMRSGESILESHWEKTHLAPLREWFFMCAIT